MAAWTGVQNSKPAWVRASRIGSESGGLRSEKRVFVNALPPWLGEMESMSSDQPPFPLRCCFNFEGLCDFVVYGDDKRDQSFRWRKENTCHLRAEDGHISVDYTSFALYLFLFLSSLLFILPFLDYYCITLVSFYFILFFFAFRFGRGICFLLSSVPL